MSTDSPEAPNKDIVARMSLSRLLRELDNTEAADKDAFAAVCDLIEERLLAQPSAAAYELYRYTVQASLANLTDIPCRNDFFEVTAKRFRDDPADFDNLYVYACLLLERQQHQRARHLFERISRSGYAVARIARDKLEELNSPHTGTTL